MLILGFLTLHAQSKFGAGIKAGPHINIHLSLFDDDRSFVAFHGGAYAHYFIFNFLAVQPEILLALKGEKLDSEMGTTKWLLTYIDVPVLLRFQIASFFSISAGPQFGYLIRAREKREVNDSKFNLGIEDRYKDFDIGLAFGTEFSLPNGIYLTPHFILGITDVNNGFYGDSEKKNSMLQLSVGYRIKGR